MTLEGFSALNHDQKLEATMDGICVAGRNDGRYLVLLYQMSAFYVEVYYNKVHHFISDMIAFDSTEHLMPYLDKISLKGLVATTT